LTPALISILTIFIQLIIVVIIQVYRIRNLRAPRLGDAFTYLRIAKEISKFRKIPRYLHFYSTGRNKPDKFTLPPLLMIILSLFADTEYKKLINISFVMDCLISAAIFVILFFSLQISSVNAALGSFIYLLSPINCTTSVSLTPRPLGLFFFLLFCIFVARYAESGLIVLFIFSCFCITGLLLAQRMVAQIVFIVSPILVLLSYFFLNTIPLFILSSVLLGGLIALLVTKGRYKEILSDHFNRIRIHFQFGDQNKFSKKFGNPLRIVKANPWLLLVLLPLFDSSIPITPETYILFGYLFGIILLAEFWFLGNGINHIYFAAPLIAIILGSYNFQNFFSQLLIIIISVGCGVIVIREFANMKKQYIGKDWFACFEYINTHQMKGYVIVLPSISFSPVAYYTSLNLISAGHGSTAMTFNRLYLKNNIHDHKLLSRFLNEIKPDFILLEKSKFPRFSRYAQQKDGQDSVKTLYENESLALMSFEPASTNR